MRLLCNNFVQNGTRLKTTSGGSRQGLVSSSAIGGMLRVAASPTGGTLRTESWSYSTANKYCRTVKILLGISTVIGLPFHLCRNFNFAVTGRRLVICGSELVLDPAACDNLRESPIPVVMIASSCLESMGNSGQRLP